MGEIWNCSHKHLQTSECRVHIIMQQVCVYTGYLHTCLSSFIGNKIRNEASEHTDTHLLIGKTERVEIHHTVIILDSKVSTLIKQWKHGSHGFCRCIEIFCSCDTPVNLSKISIEVLERLGKESRCA